MFFIFGSPRSGTTLLAQCLNSHSDILVPHETDFIIPLAFLFDRIHDPNVGREMLIQLITNTVAYPGSLGEYLRPKQIAEVIKNCEYEPAQVLNSLYAALASAASKKMAGDKSPNDINFVRILDKVGVLQNEQVKIVHIVRDIRDVMVSLSKTDWTPHIDLFFPRMWTHSNLYLNSLYKERANYFFVRYENLVTQPELVFQNICRFLEVDFQPGMLDFHNFHPRYQGVAAHSKLYAPISSANVGVYKTALSSDVLQIYEQQAQEGLQAFGYL